MFSSLQIALCQLCARFPNERSALGAKAGSNRYALWQSTRTKNWSDGWLGKLKNDQRTAKAEFAVLVSRTLPKEVVAFDFVEGVWVVEPRCAVPVAIALRQSLPKGAQKGVVRCWRQVRDRRSDVQTLVRRFALPGIDGVCAPGSLAAGASAVLRAGLYPEPFVLEIRLQCFCPVGMPKRIGSLLGTRTLPRPLRHFPPRWC